MKRIPAAFYVPADCGLEIAQRAFLLIFFAPLFFIVGLALLHNKGVDHFSKQIYFQHSGN